MKKNKGFTLIEIVLVISIIAILASLILASLGSSRNKSSDSRVQSQIKSMVAQSQLFIGPTGTAYIVSTPYSGAITGAATLGGTAASGTLFNDMTSSDYSLYRLATALPTGTLMYYGWDGVNPISGGKWFFAASTSTGGFCVDHSSSAKNYIGTALTTTLSTWTAAGVFPNATVAGGYSCN